MAPNTTTDTVLVSVSSVRVDEHEFTSWSDGSITLEHWEYSYTNDPQRDHARLDADQARALRDFLNRVLA